MDETNEKFYAYCFPEIDGWHTPAVELDSAEDIYRYTKLHGRTGMFQEIKVTDKDNFTVVQMINGKYTWPEEWKILNKEAIQYGENDTTYQANT